MSHGVTRNVEHQMFSYTWGVGGTGLRQGFKCTCGWYISENNAATAKEHLELEAAIAVMNDSYRHTLDSINKEKSK